MSQIAGAVMFVLFLVAFSAVLAAWSLLHEPGGWPVMLMPAVGLGLLALMSLAALGVIAAILATRPPPA